MADVAALAFLLIMAFRIFFAVSRESRIFREFGQSTLVGPLSFLFPAAPLVLIFGMRAIGIVPSLLLAAACFVPGLLMARRGMNAFERSGTDRTAGALSASTQAFGAGLAGLIYVAAVTAILLAGPLHG